MTRLASVILTLALIIGAAFSALAQSTPSDVEVEMRAKQVGEALRCVVCQNQSIEESDAEIAADMRKLVRERIREGDSNTDVMLYMQDRYGDYILLKPPVQANTLALWFAPVFLLLGLFVWYFVRAKSRGDLVDPLSPEERVKVEAIIKETRRPDIRQHKDQP